MDFKKGRFYSKVKIHEHLGGGIQDYLPHKDGRVVCACLRLDSNPDAPDMILVGEGGEIYRWATALCEQRSPVPVFLKVTANEWEYVGHYKVQRWTESLKELKRQAERSGRTDIARVIFLEETQAVPTYLLAWNPHRWQWDDLQDLVEQVEETGSCLINWGCGHSKRIRKGDRVFLIRLGKEPRGIIASGIAESNAYDEEHWNDDLAKAGKTSSHIRVRLDALLNPRRDPILPRAELNKGILAKMHWDTRSSGVLIPADAAQALEQVWAKFLDRPR